LSFIQRLPLLSTGSLERVGELEALLLKSDPKPNMQQGEDIGYSGAFNI